jgi:hypothetical protein
MGTVTVKLLRRLDLREQTPKFIGAQSTGAMLWHVYSKHVVCDMGQAPMLSTTTSLNTAKSFAQALMCDRVCTLLLQACRLYWRVRCMRDADQCTGWHHLDPLNALRQDHSYTPAE